MSPVEEDDAVARADCLGQRHRAAPDEFEGQGREGVAATQFGVHVLASSGTGAAAAFGTACGSARETEFFDRHNRGVRRHTWRSQRFDAADGAAGA